MNSFPLLDNWWVYGLLLSKEPECLFWSTSMLLEYQSHSIWVPFQLKPVETMNKKWGLVFWRFLLCITIWIGSLNNFFLVVLHFPILYLSFHIPLLSNYCSKPLVQQLRMALLDYFLTCRSVHCHCTGHLILSLLINFWYYLRLGLFVHIWALHIESSCTVWPNRLNL